MAPCSDSDEMDTSPHVTFQTPLQSSAPPHPHPYPHPSPSGQYTSPGMHCGRKDKMMRQMLWKEKMANAGMNKEFNAVRRQVPEEFRAWVRQYVRQWYAKGGEAACQVDSLPDGAPIDFPRWLNRFLQRYTARHAGKAADGAPEMAEEGEEEGEEEMLAAPEGLSPVYYRWLCLFVRRFCLRQATNEGDEEQQFHHEKGRHGCHGKHGWHGHKGDKQGGNSSSSESEDSDTVEKAWQKVPKEFRKFVRKTTKKLHKKKGDNSKAKEKATQAGLSLEVLEFVQQFLLEWHAKLSHKRPWAVAKEMMEEKEEERTLPSGMEREHFLWLCRFMARWHLRHAGKCDVMTGWSSGETSDDTSGEEAGPSREQGCGPWSRGNPCHFRAAMTAIRGHHHGMMGHPRHYFAVHHGMNHPFHPPPPPPFPRRHGGWGVAARGRMMSPFCAMGCRVVSPGHMVGMGRRQDSRRQTAQEGATSCPAS